MAVKAYRDYAREVKGTRRPEIVMPVTAHSAFDKAAQYFKIRIRRVPVDPVTYTVDVSAMKRSIGRNTIMVSLFFFLRLYIKIIIFFLLLLVMFVTKQKTINLTSSYVIKNNSSIK